MSSGLSEYVEPRPQTLLILTTCMTTTDWLPYLVHVYGAHFVCHDLVQEGLTFIPALVRPGQFSRHRVSIQRTEDYFLFNQNITITLGLQWSRNYLDENNIDVSESVALEHGHEVVLLHDEVQQVNGGLLVGPLDAPRLLHELLEQVTEGTVAQVVAQSTLKTLVIKTNQYQFRTSDTHQS